MRFGLLNRERAVSAQSKEPETAIECQDWIKELLAERQARRERSKYRRQVDPRMMIHHQTGDLHMVDGFSDQ
jgi:uncharacterized membrane protein